LPPAEECRLHRAGACLRLTWHTRESTL
jgi:hypothetical protein